MRWQVYRASRFMYIVSVINLEGETEPIGVVIYGDDSEVEAGELSSKRRTALKEGCTGNIGVVRGLVRLAILSDLERKKDIVFRLNLGGW